MENKFLWGQKKRNKCETLANVFFFPQREEERQLPVGGMRSRGETLSPAAPQDWTTNPKNPTGLPLNLSRHHTQGAGPDQIRREEVKVCASVKRGKKKEMKWVEGRRRRRRVLEWSNQSENSSLSLSLCSLPPALPSPPLPLRHAPPLPSGGIPACCSGDAAGFQAELSAVSESWSKRRRRMKVGRSCSCWGRRRSSHIFSSRSRWHKNIFQPRWDHWPTGSDTAASQARRPPRRRGAGRQRGGAAMERRSEERRRAEQEEKQNVKTSTAANKRLRFFSFSPIKDKKDAVRIFWIDLKK